MPQPTQPTSALVLLGGEPIEELPVGIDASSMLVVAADSGVDQAHRLGLRVDVAVGDFDSVTPDGLARAVEAGSVVERHPARKAHTDLELALDAVAVRDLVRVDVAGGDGGRLDHLLANALVMASDRFAGLDVTAHGGDGARLHVVRRRRTLSGDPGEYVTLLAVHGPADGVRTEGLLYPLHGERLEPGSSRGVSNELVGRAGVVELDVGVLLVVMPGPWARPGAPADPPTGRTTTR
ncbi:thiamine diphosphokinase [Actinomarinicola tropica]|uniref:Thiamine diphosphokinase n=1 Tax=Actinomarinicola tropica TaxID=2789776 RepID=A0A5Q2RML8_9ACTN|nr:thiamine diphosphokinase [Actinomarinicola tropica]QGG95120.1 thiamine diphosphokinase [Actinomarinicola tropica]